jgi:NitT/TauT family transport system substrate-binding protein
VQNADTSRSRLTRRGFVRTGSAAAVLAAYPAVARAADAPSVIRVGTTGKETDAQVVYAQALGYFQRAGLSVDIQVLPNGAAIAAAISGGSLRLGNGNVLTTAKAREKGLPFAIVALSAQYDDTHPATILAVAPDAPIHSGRDLNGKVLGGISLGGLDQLSMQIWVDQNGGDAATLKFIELRPSEIVPALVRGTIAAGNLSEPELSVQKKNIRVLGHSYGAVAKTYAQTAWFGNQAWIAANAPVARAFAQAMAQAAQWSSRPANHAQASQLLAQFAKLDRADASATYARTLDPALVQPVLDAGLKYKLLERAVSAGELFAPEVRSSARGLVPGSRPSD